MSRYSLEFLFYPKSVAVVGASENPMSFGCDFMNYMLSYGYSGKIYPINPKQTEIMGLKAYPSLEQVPGTIDYVICCIAVNNVPDLLTQCPAKGVKAMHIFAGRASETGRPEAKELEAEILRRAREYGIRLLGPNCLGIFCPKSGLAFGYDFPKEPGTVGAIIQSGGNSTDLVHIASLRGIRFSKLVSYGNALDINEMDLFEYFSEDPETKIILSFIEGLRGDGREFLKLVRKAASKKPVIICKGGRTTVGARITLSHTASLAGSGKTWETAMRQAGAIPVRNLDELVNMGVAFSFLPPIKGRRVGIVGAGGGRSVLSADEWVENGFDVPPLPQEIREEFKRRGSQIWDWIDNPADVSIIVPGEAFTMPAVLLEIIKHPDFDFVAVDAQEDSPFGEEHFVQAMTENMEEYIKVYKECNKPFLMVFDERSEGIRELASWNYRTRAQSRTRYVEEHVPLFPSVNEAARAVNELINYYQRKEEEAV